MCQPADPSISSSSSKEEDNHHHDTPAPRKTLNPCWTHLTEGVLHKCMKRFVVGLAKHAARYPKAWIGTVSFVSLFLIAVGFFTNFTIVYSHEEIFTPFGSLPEKHHRWIEHESGFALTRPFMVVLHRNGESMLQAASLQMLFKALQTLEETPGYEEACQQSQYLNRTNQPTCRLSSATQWWNHNVDELMQELNGLDGVQAQDEYVIDAMSNATFPDGTPVFHEAILGNHQMENTTNGGRILTTAQSYILHVDLPDLKEKSDELEKRILERMEDLRQDWASNPEIVNGVVLEYFTMYAYLLEFERAVYSDIALVVVMMVIMVCFCCSVFYQKDDPIQSRALMGVFSICTIGMSLMTGYGIVWCLGVPFTNIAMMVPFVVVGVGLDDTFIITGAYFRKSMQASRQQHKQSSAIDTKTRDEQIIARVEETFEEVGLSIGLTTTTTCLAFALGVISSIPAIRWLCIYGLVCIAVDFFYQCSYFVAWMVLDERRVQDQRKDCCFWVSLAEEDSDEDDEDDNEQDNKPNGIKDTTTAPLPLPTPPTKNFSERFMGWYADKLLHPISKIAVLLFFSVYLAGCVYSTTKLTQEFKVENYVPKGSHVQTFFHNFQEYSSLFRTIAVYFRNVDQSEQETQQQMMHYVNDLAQMEQIGEPPEFFWVRDFAEMATNPGFADQAAALGIPPNATFEEQVSFALQIPEVRDVYGKDIVQDPVTGEITASRCYMYLRQLDMASIPDQIAVLMDQREITQAQPINQDADEFSFFTFDDLYFFFELYSVSVDELIFTTISGVAAVSFVAFVLIPHWSSVAFVLPLIISLYFMLLGTMQYSGIHINAVTYVIIVMAIGLLVDFLMHMLLRYYETTGKTRHEKVKETLETMGASILLGGLTTFLGVIPLAFSTTTIFMVVFKSFLAMVCLGCGVGLILLPVLLSLVGPVVSCQHVTTAVEKVAGADSLDYAIQSKETDSSTEGEPDGRSTDESDQRFMTLVKSASQDPGQYEMEIEV